MDNDIYSGWLDDSIVSYENTIKKFKLKLEIFDKISKHYDNAHEITEGITEDKDFDLSFFTEKHKIEEDFKRIFKQYRKRAMEYIHHDDYYIID